MGTSLGSRKNSSAFLKLILLRERHRLGFQNHKNSFWSPISSAEIHIMVKMMTMAGSSPSFLIPRHRNPDSSCLMLIASIRAQFARFGFTRDFLLGFMGVGHMTIWALIEPYNVFIPFILSFNCTLILWSRETLTFECHFDHEDLH